MLITQVHLVLGAIKGHSKFCSFVTQHNSTDVTSFEVACFSMLTAGMSTRAASRWLNVNFSKISHLQWRFREFGSTFIWIQNLRPRVWRHADERFGEVNVVNRVPHGGGGVMVWAGTSCGQRTQLPFIDGNLNTQRYHDEIMRPIVRRFFLGCLWPTDAHQCSKSCKIHRLWTNAFISIDWFPYMSCNSVKSLKMLHVVFLFLFSISVK
jgi:hypothetical protein